MLKSGDRAPDFTLQSDTGEEVSLHDFRGKKVVLYFYPKDNTPGCSREANSFNEALNAITESGAVVLGVSRDGVKSHQRFKEKYNLRFILLSDPDGKVCERYGVLGEKKRFGKTYMGIFRTTFIIDEEGKIKYVFEKVKPDNHAQEVLKKLKE